MIINFRQASADDFDLVLEIIIEAIGWLNEKGIDQWGSPIRDSFRRFLTATIARGEFFIAGLDDHDVGIVRLTTTDAYWPDDDQGGYIHSLTIRRHMHGQGLGVLMIDWAAEQMRQQGKLFLRLDCLARNERLRRYYEELGFVYQRQIIDRNYTAALYEKAL